MNGSLQIFPLLFTVSKDLNILMRSTTSCKGVEGRGRERRRGKDKRKQRLLIQSYLIQLTHDTLKMFLNGVVEKAEMKM